MQIKYIIRKKQNLGINGLSKSFEKKVCIFEVQKFGFLCVCVCVYFYWQVKLHFIMNEVYTCYFFLYIRFCIQYWQLRRSVSEKVRLKPALLDSIWFIWLFKREKKILYVWCLLWMKYSFIIFIPLFVIQNCIKFSNCKHNLFYN